MCIRDRSKDDIENRFGFKGGRYTSVNHAFAFLIGALLTGLLYALMLFVFIHLPVVSKVATIYMLSLIHIYGLIA